MHRQAVFKNKIAKAIYTLQKEAFNAGIDAKLLKQINFMCQLNKKSTNYKSNTIILRSVIITIFVIYVSVNVLNIILSGRCLLPSNYLVWEATRPLSDCHYCKNITKPIILQNISREQFINYSYSSKPIIVKNAIKNWIATKEFTYDMFKQLYEETMGSYESIDEGCQFLNFKTDLFSLKEVFSMPEARVRNEPGQQSWYIGWGNCHPDILTKVRQYYNVPEFLPDDAEFPATENIFFGYEIGAVMHLDYIPRLMWQGQVKGTKIWSIAPVPECDHVCHKFQYYVEPGDAVLLDTRIWYHSTKIPKGQFSITVQSEYG